MTITVSVINAKGVAIHQLPTQTGAVVTYAIKQGERLRLMQDGVEIAPKDLKVFQLGNDLALTWDEGTTQVLIQDFALTPDAFISLPGQQGAWLSDTLTWDASQNLLGGNTLETAGTGISASFLGGTLASAALGISLLSNGSKDPTLNGGPGNDTLMGTDRADTINGLGGHDTLSGANGNDLISGGDGNDTLQGDAGDDSLFGNAGDDSLTGGVGNDQLNGGDGNDWLVGDAGDDLLNGGLGQDTANYAQISENLTLTLSDSEGSATITGASSGVDVFDSVEAYVLGDGNNTVLGGQANDQVQAGAGADSMQGNAGDDQLNGGGGDDTLDGGDGNDSLIGGDGADILQGGDGNDTLDGGLGADSIQGDAGDDQLNGGDGDDTLDGGDGNDSLLGGDGADILQGGDGNDTLDGGLGADSIQGDAGDDQLNGGDGDDTLDGGVGNDSLLGGDGADILQGGDGNDTLDGGLGADSIQGNAGDDWITASAGNDTLEGGLGADTADFSAMTQLVITYGATPGDATVTGVDAQGHSFTQVLTSIETIIGSTVSNLVFGLENNGGSQNDTLLGTQGSDSIHGLDGNDSLSGGAGNDFIYGERGDDILIGGAGNDVLHGGSNFTGVTNSYFWGGESITSYMDRVDYSGATAGIAVQLNADGQAGFVQGDISVGNDTLYEIEWVIGTTFNDTVVSSGEINADRVVWAGQGDDTVTVSNTSATGGRVIVYGGNGTDLIDGSQATVALYLEGGAGDDAADSVDGDDTLIGGSNNDSFFGGYGNDLLVGGDGAETFYGEYGNDTYYGGTASSDTGYDAIVFYNFNAQVFNLSDVAVTYAGQVYDAHMASTGVFGVDYLYGIDYVWTDAGQVYFFGSDGADRIQVGGNAPLLGDSISYYAMGDGDDRVNAASGHDSIYGGNGADSISAGAGNDFVSGDNGSDSILGLAGDDTVLGGEGDDWIDAGTGNDSMAAEMGNDTHVGGTGVDTLDYSAETGSISINLLTGGVISGSVFGADSVGAAGIEVFISGSGSDSIVGTATQDTLIGGTGNDTLDGGAGNDVLSGGSGNNSLVGNTGFDVVDYSSNVAGIQFNMATGTVIHDSGTDTLSGVEKVIGSATANNTLIGSTSNDYLVGGNGADVLMGMTGADTLDGGQGSDSLNGGTTYPNAVSYEWNTTGVMVDIQAGVTAGNQTIVVNDGTGNDTLVFIGSVYAGSGNDTLTGDDSNQNTLFGGAGNDSIDGRNGNDSLSGGQGDDTIIGGVGNDSLDAGLGNDVLFGGDGNDLLLVGGVGNKQIDAGNGTDTLSFTGITSNISHVLTADATQIIVGIDFTVQASNVEAYIMGTGNDSITAYMAGSNINGDAGSDSLIGGDGNDTLNGGVGNDYIVAGLGNNSLTGAAGVDTLDYQTANAGVQLSITGAGITGNAVFASSGQNDTMVGIEQYLLTQYDDSVSSSTGVANTRFVFMSLGGNDTINASGVTVASSSHYIDGGLGSDLMVGNQGRDVMFGDLAGSDTFDGGLGQDTILLNSHLDFVDANIAIPSVASFVSNYTEYADTVNQWTINFTSATTGTISNGSNAAVDNFNAIEHIRFTSNDEVISVTGSTADMYFDIQSGGHDQFWGGLGSDTVLSGGKLNTSAGPNSDPEYDIVHSSLGNDLYFVTYATNYMHLDYGNQTAAVTLTLAIDGTTNIVKDADGSTDLTNNVMAFYLSDYNDHYVVTSGNKTGIDDTLIGSSAVFGGAGYDVIDVTAGYADFTQAYRNDSGLTTLDGYVGIGAFDFEALSMVNGSANTVVMNYQDFLREANSWFSILGDANDVLQLDLNGGAYGLATDGILVSVDLNGNGVTTDAGETAMVAGGHVTIGGVDFMAYTTSYNTVFSNVLVDTNIAGAGTAVLL